jgi:hypothetical protein
MAATSHVKKNMRVLRVVASAAVSFDHLHLYQITPKVMKSSGDLRCYFNMVLLYSKLSPATPRG